MTSSSSPQQDFNLKPSLWGPYTWMTLHFLASVYPINHPSKDVQTAFSNLLRRLQPLLPCESCSRNYKGELKELPPEDFVSCRAHAIRFTIELHNSVNQRLHKKVYSVHEAMCVFRQLEQEPISSLRYVWVCLLALLIPLAKREQYSSSFDHKEKGDTAPLEAFWSSFWTYCKHVPQLQPFVSIIKQAQSETNHKQQQRRSSSSTSTLYSVIQTGYKLWKERYMTNSQQHLIDGVDQTIHEMRSGKGRCTVGNIMNTLSSSKNNSRTIYEDARQTADTQVPVSTCDSTQSHKKTSSETNTTTTTTTNNNNNNNNNDIDEEIAEELSPEDRQDILYYRSLPTPELKERLHRKKKRLNERNTWWTAFWGYTGLFVIMVGIVLALRFLAQRVNVNNMTDKILPRGLNAPVNNNNNVNVNDDKTA